jgi:hypothetical protein
MKSWKYMLPPASGLERSGSEIDLDIYREVTKEDGYVVQ